MLRSIWEKRPSDVQRVAPATRIRIRLSSVLIAIASLAVALSGLRMWFDGEHQRPSDSQQRIRAVMAQRSSRSHAAPRSTDGPTAVVGIAIATWLVVRVRRDRLGMIHSDKSGLVS
jgi:hypothetical protein